MITILKIGWTSFAFKNKKHAVAALQALSEAMPVDYKYQNAIEVYYPHKRAERSVLSLENIPDTRLVAEEPSDLVPETHRLNA
jgi:hypothetical protein